MAMKDMAAAFWAGIEADDQDAVRALMGETFAADLAVWNPMGALSGVEEFAGFITGFMEGFGPLGLEVKTLVETDGLIAAELTGRGTHKESGNPVVWNEAIIGRHDGSRFVSWNAYFDVADFVKQLEGQG